MLFPLGFLMGTRDGVMVAFRSAKQVYGSLDLDPQGAARCGRLRFVDAISLPSFESV